MGSERLTEEELEFVAALADEAYADVVKHTNVDGHRYWTVTARRLQREPKFARLVLPLVAEPTLPSIVEHIEPSQKKPGHFMWRGKWRPL